MSFRQIDIKHSYVSYGDENIAKAFLIPMLRKTKLYRRSVGFFSSTVFSTIIDGIVSLSRNDGKIQLIASPNLSGCWCRSSFESGITVRIGGAGGRGS